MLSAFLEFLGMGLCLLGSLLVMVACGLPMWKVTAFIDMNIVVAQTIWDGLWMSCVVSGHLHWLGGHSPAPSGGNPRLPHQICPHQDHLGQWRLRQETLCVGEERRVLRTSTLGTGAGRTSCLLRLLFDAHCICYLYCVSLERRLR
uniref:Claudin 5a n=1 Tax=Hucho hucho TaxID=62062 RepID=A0A4W5ME18_9TELE